MPLVARFFNGTLHHDSSVSRLRGSHFTVKRPAPGLIHTDEDIHEALALVEFSVRPASLRILTPAVTAR